MASAPAWVMDGNYGGTLERRVRAADTILFLDLPRTTCLTRVIRRRFSYRGTSRPTLPAGCNERLTWEFLRWVWTYPKRRRSGVLALLDRVRDGKRVVVLSSAEAVDTFLESLRRGSGTACGTVEIPTAGPSISP